MASPFPGMDPYLEKHWGDVHQSLVIYARDQLQAGLPKDLRARVEERVFVEPVGRNGRHIVPDVRVLERRRTKDRTSRTKGVSAVKSGGPALAEPIVLTLDEETTEGFIEIREASSGHRLITVIEVLSPANKVPGEGQDRYLQKRRELREGRVSLVEIDLVRLGRRPLPVPWQSLPAAYQTPYNVWIRRGWELIRVEIYRVSLRERLPIIPVPLRQTDKPAPLDLQPLIDQCYQNGGYEDDIDYTVDPYPPLEGADARWADALLRKQGLRRPKRHNRKRRS